MPQLPRSVLTDMACPHSQHEALKRIHFSMVHPCLSEKCLARSASALGIKALTSAVLADALEAASRDWEKVSLLVHMSCMHHMKIQSSIAISCFKHRYCVLQRFSV